MKQDLKTPQEAQIETASVQKEKKHRKFKSRLLQLKPKFFKDKKLSFLSISTLSLFLVILVFFIASLAKKHQENKLADLKMRSITDTKEVEKKFVFQTIEKKTNKIAFISEGNIWTVNPDGTELEQLTDIDYRLSASQDDINSYRNTFFDVLSISPDGSRLAAVGISDTIRKAIEDNDEEKKERYWAYQGYWIPSHHDIYIFNLVNNTSDIISLENYGFTPDSHERILSMNWLPDNKHLFLTMLSGRKSTIINTEDMTEGFQNIADFNYFIEHFTAYLPEASSLFFNNVHYAGLTRTEIASISLMSKPETSTVIYRMLGEKLESFVVPGVNGDIFFYTSKDGHFLIHKYNVINGTDEILLRMKKCDEISLEETCIGFPPISSYFTEQFISPNGKYVVASLNSKNRDEIFDKIKIYRIEDMKEVYNFTSDKWGNKRDEYKWSSDGESMLYAGKEGRLLLVNLGENKETIVTTKPLAPITWYNSFDWNHLY